MFIRLSMLKNYNNTNCANGIELNQSASHEKADTDSGKCETRYFNSIAYQILGQLKQKFVVRIWNVTREIRFKIRRARKTRAKKCRTPQLLVSRAIDCKKYRQTDKLTACTQRDRVSCVPRFWNLLLLTIVCVLALFRPIRWSD